MPYNHTSAVLSMFPPTHHPVPGLTYFLTCTGSHFNCRLLQRYFRDISLAMSSRKYPCRGWQLRWRPCWTWIMRSLPRGLHSLQSMLRRQQEATVSGCTSKCRWKTLPCEARIPNAFSITLRDRHKSTVVNFLAFISSLVAFAVWMK